MSDNLTKKHSFGGFRIYVIILLFISNLNILNAREVDMDLLLLIDSSGSIDESESQLQFAGYADAFRNKDVVDAILAGPNQSIAVCVLLFSDNTVKLIDWTLIDSFESSLNFASLIQRAPRMAGGTFIVQAIRDSIIEFSNCPYKSRSLAIDISGDGPDNQFEMPQIPMDPLNFINLLLGNQTQAYGYSKIINDINLKMMRDQAQTCGIDINCLAIEDPMMKSYYENNLMTGGQSFTLYVKNFSDFHNSVYKKILSEIKNGTKKTEKYYNMSAITAKNTNSLSETKESRNISNNAPSNITNSIKDDLKSNSFVVSSPANPQLMHIIICDCEYKTPVSNAWLNLISHTNSVFFEKGAMPGNYEFLNNSNDPAEMIEIGAPSYESKKLSVSELNSLQGRVNLHKAESKMCW